MSLHLANPGQPVQCLGAIFLGEDSPNRVPEDFLQAIGELILLTKVPNVRNLSLVVNTMGWVSGLAQDLLEAILQHIEPTDIVQIVPELKLEKLGSLIPASLASSVIKWTLNPAVENRQRESSDDVQARLADLFFKAPTFCVGLNRVKITLQKSLADSQLPVAFSLLVLNANLVGLLRSGPEPRAQRFIAIGLVHLVDLERQCVVLRIPNGKLSALHSVEELIVASSASFSPTQFPTRSCAGTRPYVCLKSTLVGIDVVRGDAPKRKRLDT